MLKELLEQKENIMREKARMEAEYKNIPENSKSIASKRKKKSLGLELSMNYSKLVSINSKIKNYQR